MKTKGLGQGPASRETTARDRCRLCSWALVLEPALSEQRLGEEPLWPGEDRLGGASGFYRGRTVTWEEHHGSQG